MIATQVFAALIFGLIGGYVCHKLITNMMTVPGWFWLLIVTVFTISGASPAGSSRV